MVRQRINEFIAQFAAERGLPLAPLNAASYTELAIGSVKVRINFLEELGVALFFTQVMPVPERNTEAFYRRLLERSFLETSEAAFAIDKKTDQVYLRIFRRLEGVDYHQFYDMLDSIETVTRELADKLRTQFPS